MKVDLLVGAVRSEKAATEKYANNLIRWLTMLGHSSMSLNVIAYNKTALPFSSSSVDVIQYFMKVTACSRSASIKHITSQEYTYLLNLKRLKPSVATCHDIGPITLPEFMGWSRKFFTFCIEGMMKSDMIIADSAFTKSEILKHLRYPEEKIEVIHLGVNHEKFKPTRPDPHVLIRHGIWPDEKYLLYVGVEHPRKNLEGAIKAFYKVKKKLKRVKFVKVGKPSWLGARRRLQTLVQALDLVNDVVFTEYVKDNELVQIYCGAQAFVFPSFYEGFGLPVLEAMACGTPVVASNTSSLPEIVGNAALTVEPLDIDAMADAMYAVLSNSGLRYDLARRGLKRASPFTWERTAKRVLGVYEAIQA